MQPQVRRCAISSSIVLCFVSQLVNLESPFTCPMSRYTSRLQITGTDELTHLRIERIALTAPMPLLATKILPRRPLKAGGTKRQTMRDSTQDVAKRKHTKIALRRREQRVNCLRLFAQPREELQCPIPQYSSTPTMDFPGFLLVPRV